jgi:hypothetical protein
MEFVCTCILNEEKTSSKSLLAIPKKAFSSIPFRSQNKQYIQYSKLKRIINRRKFIADRDEAEAQAKGEFRAASSSPMNNAPAVILNPSNEYTLLQPIASGKTQNSYVDESNGNSGIELVEGGPVDDESDFFKIILSEIEKVNKFFVG